MPSIRRFLSRRWLLAFLGAGALLFGLAMLHPYPRQSLFGPTIRGKPWCVWEAEVRRSVHREEYEKTLYAKTLRWMGVKHEEKNMELHTLLNHREMLPLVLELAEDRDQEIRWHVLWLFPMCDSLRDPSALAVLRRRLQDDDPHCRVMAARGLWVVAQDKQGFPVILRDLQDCQDEAQRREAIWLFTNACHAAPELYPCLAAHAKHPNFGIRKEVMVAMGKFGKKGLPILLQGLDDSDVNVRFCAVTGLEELGNDAREAIPALQRRLDDTDQGLRLRTVDALRAIDPDHFRHLKAKQKIE
jgi:HEAT repeat protein